MWEGFDKISLGLVQALARGSSAPAHPAQGTGVTGRAEQSFLLIISSVPGLWECHSNSEGQVTFRNARAAVPTGGSSARGPAVLAGGAGWGVCSSQGVPDSPLGRVHSPRGDGGQQGHSELGHLALLPAGTAPSAPRKARPNPKLWGRAFPCLVPPPPGGAGCRERQSGSAASRGMSGSRRHLPSPVCGEGAGRCSPSPAQQHGASTPCLACWEARSALQKPWQLREAG